MTCLGTALLCNVCDSDCSLASTALKKAMITFTIFKKKKKNTIKMHTSTKGTNVKYVSGPLAASNSSWVGISGYIF